MNCGVKIGVKSEKFLHGWIAQKQVHILVQRNFLHQSSKLSLKLSHCCLYVQKPQQKNSESFGVGVGIRVKKVDSAVH